jgi:hypothetical protein
MSKRTGWGCEFDEPIELPEGRQLVTLADAGDYITKLPVFRRGRKAKPAPLQSRDLEAGLRPPPLQIAHDCSVAMVLAKSPVLDAD